MKHTLLLFATALLLGIQSYAQTGVAINPTGAEADSSAMLDVSSTTKGLLVPRMTEAQRTAIVRPVKGLLVYQIDGTEGFYYYDGSAWTNLSLVNFSESSFLFDSKYGVKLLAKKDAQNNVDFVISPKGTGAILARQPDGSETGGNNRGNYAVDLQLLRTYNTQIASGEFSVIGGGLSNTSGGTVSTIAGGYQNTASGYVSTIGGGLTNISGGEYSTVSGGFYNTASGNYSTIGGGRENIAPSFGETVFGYLNTTYSPGPNGATDPNPTDRLFTIGNGNSSERSNALTILKNANTTIGGTLEINKNGTNTSFTFPATRGTNGQVLSTNGSGTLSWISPALGTVTGVTGTAPIVSSGGTAPVISISAATTSAEGSMSAADKTKLDGYSAVHVIGESYGGGIIFWLDASKQHGLIAATTDQSAGIRWYNGTNTNTTAILDAVYAGKANTRLIIASQGAGSYAAKLCDDYAVTVNNEYYDDWYLPSKYELNLLYLQKGLPGLGDLATGNYWSSNESNSVDAYMRKFFEAYSYPYPKNTLHQVRAIRAF